MTLQTSLVRNTVREPVQRAVRGDSRRHRRIPLEVSGRYMVKDKSEHTCTTQDISVGGAHLKSANQPALGERVVLYLDNLGGVEATVMRWMTDGFAVNFNITEHKREKLAAQLTWLLNREAYPEHEGRTHERAGAGGRRTSLQLEEGVTIDVELMDLSASGASIGTSARPALGEVVHLAKLPAVVRRHHDQGIGVQFVAPQTQEMLRRYFP